MSSQYSQLCPVLYGPDALNELGAKAKELGGSRAILVYDKGIGSTGIIEKIEKMLTDEGIFVLKFDGVLADAPKDMVNSVGQLAQDNNIDMIVGIGGGSSLDTAKAVAILVENPLPIDQYYAQFGKPFKQSFPLILIPTASGTGSEVTAISVIHDEDTDAKEFVLRPGNLAILDPKVTLSLPPHVTAATGMDAMSHAVEALTSKGASPKSDLLALHAIKLIAENLAVACEDGSNLEARSNLSLASNFAGMAFSDASVHWGHAAAHEMGIKFHMPHGDACALTLPEVVKSSAELAPEVTKKIAEALQVEVPAGASAVEVGEMAAKAIRDLMKKVGIKSLKDRGITREEAIACAKGAVEKNWFVIMALMPVDIPFVEGQMAAMYDNY
ncbi:MAG: iron-containing alcohol dehydrogenase [Mogibacterium sp.]|nr:iron-containing alcohol dehydrogenase [Mogibacterium sp.]